MVGRAAAAPHRFHKSSACPERLSVTVVAFEKLAPKKRTETDPVSPPLDGRSFETTGAKANSATNAPKPGSAPVIAARSTVRVTGKSFTYANSGKFPLRVNP